MPGFVGGFHFLTTSYDRQALVLAGTTATDLFSATRIPQSAFCNCDLTELSRRGDLKRFLLSLYIILGDSLHGKVFSIVSILLGGAIVK